MLADPYKPLTLKQKIKLYKPHSGQLRVHRSKARFRVVVCGRRYGKTLMACNEIVKHALDHSNHECAWVAPTYRQSKIAYRLIRKALRHIVTYKSDTDLRLEFANGSYIQFFSSDNYDALRGYGFHFLVVDEFADVDEKAWKEALRATLTDKVGLALIIGTPKGMNFFYEVFQRGADKNFVEWESFSAPTSANPYVRAGEIESAKQELPEDVFNQEYLAVFLKTGAGVFRGLEECITGQLDPDYQPEPGHIYTMGWDPAKHADYSVISVLDATTGRQVYWDRLNEVDYVKQVKWAAGIAAKFRAHVWLDVTGVGSPIYDFLRPLADKLGVHVSEYLFTHSTKKELIEGLQIAIQNREISIPEIEIQSKELRQFQYKMLPSRALTYEAPTGAHDDCVMALALSRHGAKQPRGPLMWTADGSSAPARTLEQPDQIDTTQYAIVQVESWENPDSGEWYEYE